MIAGVIQDIRYAARRLMKSPTFTAVAVLSLALGIGVNTAIFTLFYTLVWRPLPVRDPATVVGIYQEFHADGYKREVAGNSAMLSYPEYLNYRNRSRSFAGVVAYTEETLTLSAGDAERVNGQLVSDNYFSTLGARAALGRLFVPNACLAAGACPEAVLSHGFWQQRFGGDSSVIGRSLTINRQPLTIVGVTEQRWTGTEVVAPDVWVSLSMANVSKAAGRDESEAGDYLSRRDLSWLVTLGRLRAGVSLAEAQTELNALARQSDADGLITARDDRNTRVSVLPGSLANIPEARKLAVPAGVGLMAALGLVLLVVCANVSNLLLARAATRQVEIGVRLALGAGRRRLIQQLMTESVLLAALGGAVGLLLAAWIPAMFLAAVPLQGLSVDLHPNWTVFLFCTVVVLIAAFLFGLAPALQATRRDLVSMIKGGAATPSGRISGGRLRSALVTTQVAVSFALLVTAGLLLRGVQRAESTDVGFERSNVFVVSSDPAAAGYDATRAAVFYQQLVERLQSLPGVQSVSLSAVTPFGATRSTSIELDGKASAQQREARLNVVSPSYFETLGIPLLHGRAFTAEDVHSRRPAVVVSEAMANRFWPGDEAIGKRFNSEYEVVGVAKDVSSVKVGTPDGPFFYAPLFSDQQLGSHVLVRVGSDQQGFSNSALAAVRQLDRNVAITVKSLDSDLSRKLQPVRFGAMFASAVSLLALVLVSAGIYGVMAFLVSQRTREIGIRKALGARTSDLQRMIVMQGMPPVGVGLSIGLVLTLGMTRLLSGVLYGVSPADPITYLIIVLLLTIVALLASFIPAWRAARIDPLTALRHD